MAETEDTEEYHKEGSRKEESLYGVFATINDNSSLIVLMDMIKIYVTRGNIKFEKNGISFKEMNKSNTVLIEFLIKVKKLKYYSYQQDKEQFVGFEMKHLHENLKSVSSKQCCYIYNMLGNGNFFLSGENNEGVNMIDTIIEPICDITSPVLHEDNLIVKMTTQELSSLCSSFNQINCKKVRFRAKNSTLEVQAYTGEKNTVYNGIRPFRNGCPFDNSEVQDEPKIVKKGKMTFVIESSEQYIEVYTHFANIKPFSKIHNLCKLGIVEVYMYKMSNNKSKEETAISFRVKVGQIGVSVFHLRNCPEI